MDSLKNSFLIKRIKKTVDIDYLLAIKIYNEATPIDIKTNTNEITFWIDSPLDSQTRFELMTFMLYLDEKIVGFAMMSYLIQTRIVVIDYISIYEEYRKNVTFFPYISLLQSYLNENNYNVSYILNEVSNKNQGLGIDKESRVFKRLFCMEGFGRINAKYYTPPLGLDNYESVFEAFLYVKSSDNIRTITKDTYLKIITSIYYDYFYTWYTPFFMEDEKSKYKNKLDDCIKKIEKETNLDIIDVHYIDCPLLVGSKDESIIGSIPAQKKKRLTVWPLIIFLSLICPLLIIWFYNWTLNRLGIPLSSVSSIIGPFASAIITSLVSLLAIKKKL